MTSYRVVVRYMHHGSPHTAEYSVTASSLRDARREVRTEFERTHETGTTIASMRCHWRTGSSAVKQQESVLTY